MKYEPKDFLTKSQNQAIEFIIHQLELLKTIYLEFEKPEELKEVNAGANSTSMIY